ncbi:MAG TPA: adenylate/guanylate cyclase domain-containing protein [Gaiellaceae bacterium]
MAFCTSCGAENREEARFCDACGAALSSLPTRESRKTVTVLFCDVTGSTAMGEKIDPESLRRVMSRYFEVAKAIIERHGGTVEKFIGDAIMAVFGVPALHEDDALRGVRAAAELRDARAALNEELVQMYGTRIDLRIGVNTGEVVTGTEERLATGDAVNVAARLEQAAEPGEVLVGPATVRLVRDAVTLEPVEPQHLKGKAEPIAAFRLLELRPLESASARVGVAMVGRERQRQLLHDAFANVVGERSCHLFTILGTAGVGKSRLVTEFLEGLDGATVIGGRCLSYGEGISYWPVTAAVKQLLGPSPDDRLAELGLDPATARTLDPILGRVAVASSPQEIAWAVRKLFEAAAADQPLVVVFDDLHWGEPVFLELVEHVADFSRDAPILLLCMGRPELLDRSAAWGGGKLNATNVLLEPLSVDETTELIARLLPPDGISASLRDRIVEVAGGNPLFVGEMLAMLAEGGNGSGEIVVPPTIQALLASRLDQLEEAERKVLERGAVEGQVFHRGAVVALAPEEGQVDGRLMMLVRKDLVRPEQSALAGDDAYRFRHLLIRDAAYEALPKATRAELHERFADWLVECAPDLVELDEIAGYHLEQAASYRAELGPLDDAARTLAPRAAERLLTASRRAFGRGDIPAVENLAPRVVSLAPRGSVLHREAMLELSRALIVTAQFEAARAVLQELQTAAELAGDRKSASRRRLLEVELQVEHDKSARMETALAVVEEARSELAALGDDEGVAWALRLAGNLRAWLGLTEEADQVWAQALEYAQRAESPARVAEILYWKSWSLWWGPTPAGEGLVQADEIIERAVGHPQLEAVATVVRGRLKGMRGDLDGGRADLRTGRTRLREIGQLQNWAGTAMMDADLELLAGNAEAAETVLRESYDFMGKTTETGFLATITGYLATAALELGRDDEALALAEEVERITQPDDFEPHVRQGCVRACVYARRGADEEAIESVRLAAAIADATGYTILREFVALSRAEVERRGGRLEGERRALEDALRLAELKEDVVTAERARLRLVELGDAET